MARRGEGGEAADVLIVGAGPVGLTLALGLHAHGLRVRIVDRSLTPQQEPRAAVLWPRGAEALDDVGAAAPLRASANALKTVGLFSRGRPIDGVALGGLDSAYPHPLLIEQHMTERLLGAELAARGVTVERGIEAVAVDLRPDGAAATLRRTDTNRESEAHSAWVVGCDGGRSAVREAAGVAFPGRPCPNLQILQVDAEARWRHPYDPNTGFYFIAPDACLGVFPRPEGGYRFFCYTTDPDPSVAQPPTLAAMRDLIARVACTPELVLSEAVWLNRARFQQRFAATLRRGRLLLAGDAAHVWPSIGGHGMNIGIRGAHNLAWKLAAVHRGEAPDGLLDTYEVEQRRTVADFQRLMTCNLLEHPTTPLGFAPRELFLRVGLKVPGLPRMLERAVSDLDAAHDRSPLSCGIVRAGPKLAAGARLPDAPVTVAGRRMTSHQLLAYERWTLLAPAGPGVEHLESARRSFGDRLRLTLLDDAEGALAPLFRRRLAVLVRPDRHIGVAAPSSDVTALRDYLDRWFVAERRSAERTERRPPSRPALRAVR